MKTDSPAQPHLAGDLYALIAHLHGECNEDLVDAIHNSELAFSEIKLLRYLSRSPVAPTVKRAAIACRISPPAASKMIDRLHAHGLVDRDQDDRDKRCQRLYLTPRGRDRLEQLDACRLTALEDFVDELDDRERTLLAAALIVLARRPEIARRRPAPAGPNSGAFPARPRAAANG